MSSESCPRPLVLVRGLTKTYIQRQWPHRRSHRALNGVDLMLRSGKTLALVGDSGSGKTTLAMCVAALERPDAGEIWIDGCDLVSAGRAQLSKIRSQVQIVLQDSAGALSPYLTAAEIVEEPLRLQTDATQRQRNDLVAGLFSQVGLAPDLKTRRARQLSGGQRQRLAIARALALRPRLIILDEPFTGLDLSARGQIINLLIELQLTLGLSYLYVSHELDVVSQFADEIAVMYDGRIVEWGQAELVLAHPAHATTQSLLGASATLAAARPLTKGAFACATC